jgi:hypothetical protein
MGKSVKQPDQALNLLSATKLSRISEALDNYAVIDEFSQKRSSPGTSEKNPVRIFDEGYFWRSFFHLPDSHWGQYFRIDRCLVSHWIPRVPGLFHTGVGRKLRDEGLKHKQGSEIEFSKTKILRPLGKSGFVLGGIGTFQLPPDDKGNQLVTLSLAYNASSGIPALMPDELVNKLRLHEGCMIQIRKGQWKKMSIEWAQRFPSMREIKRGCLVVKNENDITVIAPKNPILVHPFSIMEYETANGLMYDFVFATANSQEKKYRSDVTKFFEKYRGQEGRNGTFLVAADVANPLFDSRYADPSALRQDHVGLNLIRHRINNLLIGQRTIDEMAEFIAVKFQTLDELRALAIQLAIPIGKVESTRPGDFILNLLNFCIEHSKTDELTDFLSAYL